MLTPVLRSAACKLLSFRMKGAHVTIRHYYTSFITLYALNLLTAKKTLVECLFDVICLA